MFAETSTAFRTKTDGLGTMTLSELRKHCNEFTGDFTVECGDWVPIGATSLTAKSGHVGGRVHSRSAKDRI